VAADEKDLVSRVQARFRVSHQTLVTTKQNSVMEMLSRRLSLE